MLDAGIVPWESEPSAVSRQPSATADSTKRRAENAFLLASITAVLKAIELLGTVVAPVVRKATDKGI
jgi:hypothetical protein